MAIIDQENFDGIYPPSGWTYYGFRQTSSPSGGYAVSPMYNASCYLVNSSVPSNADVIAQFDFQFVGSLSQGYNAGLVIRGNSDLSHGYKLTFEDYGTIKFVAATASGSPSLYQLTGVGFSANQWYSAQITLHGSSWALTLWTGSGWFDGTSFSTATAAPFASGTNSAITASGNFGLVGQFGTGGVAPLLDNFLIQDYANLVTLSPITSTKLGTPTVGTSGPQYLGLTGIHSTLLGSPTVQIAGGVIQLQAIRTTTLGSPTVSPSGAAPIHLSPIRSTRLGSPTVSPSGAASITLQPIRSTRLGNPTIRNLFNWKRKVVVPSSKVGENISKFYLLVRLTINQAHVNNGTFQFLDNANNPLTSEILYWDSLSGNLLAQVETPLSPAETDLWLRY